MAESPFKDPLDIATALQELASFLRSAGFPEAGALVAKAAQSAATQIDRVQAKIELRRMNQHQARGDQSADIIALDPLLVQTTRKP